ncbi:hypothetical protein H0H92_010838 [Tricholoma furcatifolium]|nr:hypothetical protein H0H92_010838 [Tricholoma furcatifolium]
MRPKPVTSDTRYIFLSLQNFLEVLEAPETASASAADLLNSMSMKSVQKKEGELPTGGGSNAAFDVEEAPRHPEQHTVLAMGRDNDPPDADPEIAREPEARVEQVAHAHDVEAGKGESNVNFNNRQAAAERQRCVSMGGIRMPYQQTTAGGSSVTGPAAASTPPVGKWKDRTILQKVRLKDLKVDGRSDIQDQGVIFVQGVVYHTLHPSVSQGGPYQLYH